MIEEAGGTATTAYLAGEIDCWRMSSKSCGFHVGIVLDYNTSVASRNCYNQLYLDLCEASGKLRGQRGVYASQCSL